jgi:type III secretory pathway component EscR
MSAACAVSLLPSKLSSELTSEFAVCFVIALQFCAVCLPRHGILC